MVNRQTPLFLIWLCTRIYWAVWMEEQFSEHHKWHLCKSCSGDYIYVYVFQRSLVSRQKNILLPGKIWSAVWVRGQISNNQTWCIGKEAFASNSATLIRQCCRNLSNITIQSLLSQKVSVVPSITYLWRKICKSLTSRSIHEKLLVLRLLKPTIF